MQFQLRISTQAQRDIESIYHYVQKDGVTVAKKQVSLIYAALENLQIFPEMGANLSAYTVEKNDYKFLSIKKHTLLFTELLGTRYAWFAFSGVSRIILRNWELNNAKKD